MILQFRNSSTEKLLIMKCFLRLMGMRDNIALHKMVNRQCNENINRFCFHKQHIRECSMHSEQQKKKMKFIYG